MEEIPRRLWCERGVEFHTKYSSAQAMLFHDLGLLRRAANDEIIESRLAKTQSVIIGSDVKLKQ